MPPDEFDTNDTGLKDQIESAVVTHGHDPDADRVENIARDHQEMVRRAPDPKNVRTISDFAPQDRLRATIRNAITAHKARDSGNPAFQPPAKGKDAPIGPPITWSQEAKIGWKDLPQETRLAALKEQKTYMDAVEPIGLIAKRAHEIDQAIAPFRGRIPANVSEPQAIKALFEWESVLNNPHTRQAAFVSLGQSLGLLPNDAGQYAQTSQPVVATMEQWQEREIATHLQEFSKGHEHFDKVRYNMGLILQNSGENYINAKGQTDLEKLYRDACRAQGLHVSSDDRVRRADRAAVSPSTRAPSAANQSAGRGQGHDVRSSIKAAISEVRGGGRV
jgi:hypothetical protein